MSKPVGKAKPKYEYGLIRLLSFLCFSTVGMASIGLAILSPPLAEYYADQEIVRNQYRRLEHLHKVHADREELLGHVDHPGVIERAAINHLHYEPIQTAGGEVKPLPQTWPELEEALARIESDPELPPKNYFQKTAEALAGKPVSRAVLFALGAALVLLSLTCFNKPR